MADETKVFNDVVERSLFVFLNFIFDVFSSIVRFIIMHILVYAVWRAWTLPTKDDANKKSRVNVPFENESKHSLLRNIYKK